MLGCCNIKLGKFEKPESITTSMCVHLSLTYMSIEHMVNAISTARHASNNNKWKKGWHLIDLIEIVQRNGKGWSIKFQLHLLDAKDFRQWLMYRRANCALTLPNATHPQHIFCILYIPVPKRCFNNRVEKGTKRYTYYTTAETNQNEITTAETTKTTMLFFNWKFVRVLFHNGKLCAIFAMHFIIIFLFHRQITREKIIKHFRGIYTCCSYTTCIEDHTIIYKWQHRNA